MSLAQSFGAVIRDRIISLTGNIFKEFSVDLIPDIIINEHAQLNGECLKSTFYVIGLENVNRKKLAELVINQNNPNMIFRVKSKRPNKEVRFYLEVKS